MKIGDTVNMYVSVVSAVAVAVGVVETPAERADRAAVTVRAGAKMEEEGADVWFRHCCCFVYCVRFSACVDCSIRTRIRLRIRETGQNQDPRGSGLPATLCRGVMFPPLLLLEIEIDGHKKREMHPSIRSDFVCRLRE